jgi:hypothetical protein
MQKHYGGVGSQFVGQLVGAGHERSLYEQQYDSNVVALECVSGFQPHLVIGALQALLMSRVRRSYAVLINLRWAF